MCNQHIFLNYHQKRFDWEKNLLSLYGKQHHAYGDLIVTSQRFPGLNHWRVHYAAKKVYQGEVEHGIVVATIMVATVVATVYVDNKEEEEEEEKDCHCATALIVIVAVVAVTMKVVAMRVVVVMAAMVRVVAVMVMVMVEVAVAVMVVDLNI